MSPYSTGHYLINPRHAWPRDRSRGLTYRIGLAPGLATGDGLGDGLGLAPGHALGDVPPCSPLHALP
jgi:hypothetical protein